MFALFLNAADPVADCVAAVHANAPAARITAACTPPAETDRLWRGGPDCTAVMDSGRGIAEMDDLPQVMRTGVLRDFDMKVAACRVQPEAPKTVEVQHLWD